MGFSDALWALLIQTWLEIESPDSLSVRPDIISILEQLQDEAQNWSLTGGVLSPAIPMERKVICMFSVFPELTLAYSIITAESTIESSGFLNQLVGNTGLFFVVTLVKEHVLTTISRRQL